MHILQFKAQFQRLHFVRQAQTKKNLTCMCLSPHEECADYKMRNKVIRRKVIKI